MKNYRDKLATAIPPMVPFLPIYLKDLTFINDGNPSKIDGLVNIDKLRMIAERVLQITSVAKILYDFQTNPALLNYISRPPMDLPKEVAVSSQKSFSTRSRAISVLVSSLSLVKTDSNITNNISAPLVNELDSSNKDVSKSNTSLKKSFSLFSKKRSIDSEKPFKEEIKTVKPTETKKRTILLLGTSDSGKSTILKQLEILHGAGFDIKQKVIYRSAIWASIRKNIIQLVKGIKEKGLINEIGTKISGLEVCIKII